MALSRPLVRLRPKEGRRVRVGAPWVFSNEIVMDDATKKLQPGTLVRLAQVNGEVLGTGYFNPKSLIAVRLLSRDPNEGIGLEFFLAKLKQAIALRNAVFNEPNYRLVHAEGDFLPGLVVDRFDDVLVVQVTTAGMELMLPLALAAVQQIVAPKHVVLRNDAPSRALEGLDSYVRVAFGDPDRHIIVRENGARYLADALEGQKTGWFYDQRENRKFVAALCREARVLDAYCYTGGFGILAALCGARNVTGIDSSESALALGRRSAAENSVDQKCEFRKTDVMDELERLAANDEKFDVVISDPPPFVRAHKDLEVGARAYRKLARLAASVTAPGGFVLLSSCSHNISKERFETECAAGIARAARDARLIRNAGAGADHPVHSLLPETSYLKALCYQLS